VQGGVDQAFSSRFGREYNNTNNLFVVKEKAGPQREIINYQSA